MKVPVVGKVAGAVGGGLGIGIGVGAVLVGATAVRGGELRPITRAAVKAGLVVADLASRGVAHAREATEDIVAEARAEREIEMTALERHAEAREVDTVVVAARAGHA